LTDILWVQSATQAPTSSEQSQTEDVRKEHFFPSDRAKQLHRMEQPTSSKKAKKAQKHLQNMGAYGYHTTTTTTSSAFDPNDQAALERRAARFALEPERKKTLQVSGGAGISNGAGPSLPKANLQRGHLFESKSLLSRSASPYGLDAAAADDPEADPVRGTPHGRALSHA
jgi:hypothetical protein